MREILFRGKRVDNEEWLYGAYYKQKMLYGYEWEADYIIKTNNVMSNDLIIEYVKVIPETVGQFTGLTDKKGKKVFEGDIVKATICINDWSRDGVRNEEGIYEIKYHTEHWYFYLAKEGNNLLFDGNWRYFLKEIKVIGNKWDNPELLGE